MTLCTALQEKFAGEQAFEQVLATEGKIYRNFKGRKTLRFEHSGQGYFLKIHPGVGWGEICKALLHGKAPVLGAKDEHDAILALERIGVRTMKIAGYGLRGRSPAAMQSFIITEEIEDAVSLEDLVLEKDKYPLSPVQKRALIRKVAEIARTMHRKGVNHCDFYLCHFLLPVKWLAQDPVDSEPPLHVIDLHRTQLRSVVPRRWLEKDLTGLHFSSMDAGLTCRDRLRFASCYETRPVRLVAKQSTVNWAKITRKAAALYRKFERHQAR
jgi:heptose I phosphotransferase